jgi:hypothetical protein
VSNSLAISAVTTTIRVLLDRAVRSVPALAGTTITTKPPGTARGSNRGPQLNIFLYEVRPNAAFWNDDPHAPNAFPPLALDLYYLLTAYGDEGDDEDELSQQILGRALSTLHDHPLLGAAEIQNAVTGSELENQIERVKITFQVLTNEDIWKLWSAFQTPFRLSAAYEASVVLIDSTRAAPAALPVLKRGAADTGVQTVPSPSPSLDSAAPVSTPPRQVAVLGDDLAIAGQSLDGDGISVRLTGPAQIPVRDLMPAPGATPTSLTVHLPGPSEDPDLSGFAPGIYLLQLVVTRAGVSPWTTNQIPFALAPTVTVSPLAAAAGDITITIVCRPRLRDGQKAILLLGDRQVPVTTQSTPADTSQPTTLTFLVTGVTAGRYVTRLRVDGVDSLPVIITGTPPAFQFDPAQTVIVT